MPASTHENRASELMLEHLPRQGVTGRLGRSRRLAKSFENTATSATGWLQVACIATTLRHLSGSELDRRQVALAA